MDARYVETGHFPGRAGGVNVFKQPSAILANDDGSVWLAAYGSNELVKVDVNGVVRDRKRGNITSGFLRPYDVVRAADGRMFVSEFRGGRVSVLDEGGNWLSFIGGKCIADGELVAPSNMALDDEGYLYVVDYGNPRITKFSPDGAFVQNFGERSYGFNGFISPTGIAVYGGIIYAADSVQKSIHSFDRNGRPLGSVDLSGNITDISAPEGIRLISAYNDGGGSALLLISDGNRLLTLDTQTNILSEAGVIGNSGSRLLSAGVDANGNILAANFSGNEVQVMAPIEEISSGLFVEIKRIVSSNYPKIYVDISVEDSRRRPLVGLDINNFILMENSSGVADLSLLGASYRENNFDISIMLDRSPRTAAPALRTKVAEALRNIAGGLNGTEGKIVSIISAGKIPARLDFNPNNLRSIENTAQSGSGDAERRFDLGLRLAAGDLLSGAKKRHIFYITSGAELGDAAFEQYALAELAAYMLNNDIIFNTVLVDEGAAGDELGYLCSETGGSVIPLYKKEGLASVVGALGNRAASSYTLSFTATGNARDAGFVPVEAEVYLLERSGRDSAGFFLPAL